MTFGCEGVAMDNRARIEGIKKEHYIIQDRRNNNTRQLWQQVSIDEIIGGKQVTGDQLKDGSTSSMLNL